MKVIKTLLIFLLSTYILTAQENEIIQLESDIINTSNPKKKADLLYDLSWEYIYINNNNKAIENAQKALKISQKNKYIKGEINALNALGTIALDKREYQKGIEYAKKQLAKSQKSVFKYGIARSYHQLALFNFETNDNIVAEQYCQKALKYYNILQNKPKVYDILNLQATILKENDQPDSALIVYRYILTSLEKENGDALNIADTKLNLGLLNFKLKQYIQAKQFFESAQSIYEVQENNFGLVAVHNSLGMLFQALDNKIAARQSFEECIKIKKSADLNNEIPKVLLNLGIISLSENKLSEALTHFKSVQNQAIPPLDSAFTYFNLGELYIKNNQIDLAIQTYQKALDITLKLNESSLKKSVFRGLAIAYRENGDANKSMDFYRKHSILEDSINTGYARAFDLKTTLDKEKAKQQRQKLTIIYIIIISVLIIGSLFFLMYYRNKKQLAEKEIIYKEKEIENLVSTFEVRFNYAKLAGQDQEKERIATDLHDRLGSMLATVKLHFQSLDKKIDALGDTKNQYNKANNLLDDACEEVRNISHDMQSSILKQFGLMAQIKSLATTINEAQEIKIKVSEHGLEERIDNKKERNIYQIIQELVTNVLKHAKATTLTITLTRRNEILNIIVEDNGKGFNFNKRSSGIGLRNIEARVHELGGEIDFDTGAGVGTTVVIDINIGK